MTDAEILEILKIDLMLSTAALDEYLLTLIKSARAMIANEGTHLTSETEDSMLVEMYAAYLYRSRKDSAPMPRMLRLALNNRLFREKGTTNG